MKYGFFRVLNHTQDLNAKKILADLFYPHLNILSYFSMFCAGQKCGDFDTILQYKPNRQASYSSFLPTLIMVLAQGRHDSAGAAEWDSLAEKYSMIEGRR